MVLKEELARILKGEVNDSPDALTLYSRDASLLEVRPRIVVFPKDVEDIKTLVTFAQEHPEEKLALTCRSAGTDMTGGALGESIIVDMARHFNKILDIGDRIAKVQPGVFYRDFEKAVGSRGLLLPSYPASKDLCTVGGMVANNSGGEQTLSWGKTEDYIVELKIVLADGNEYKVKALSQEELDGKMTAQGFEGDLYRRLFCLVRDHEIILKDAKPKVSKNSAGYYLWNVWDGKTFQMQRLICGSQGTFGIITEITFRLVSQKKHASLLVLFVHGFEDLGGIVQKLLSHHPETIESYDDHTLRFAMVHIPDFIKLLKGNIISLALQFLPEFWMFVCGGFRFPKLVVLAEFTGDSEEEVHEKALAAQVSLREFSLKSRVAKTDTEEEKFLTVRRESFTLLRKHAHGVRTAPFIDDLIVLPALLPQFLPKLDSILKKYPSLVYTVAGHVGDGNFHIIPLMDVEKKENRDLIFPLMEEVYALVFSFAGSMTAEHNDGIMRTPFLEQMYGKKIVELFEETKNMFDPTNIFNPGKKVRGSKEYIVSHLITKNA